MTLTPTTPTCSIEDCTKPVKARGWCQSHYLKLRGAAPCKEDDCPRPVIAKGWCHPHYYALRTVPPCTVESCDRPQQVKGWCRSHYEKLRESDQVCKVEDCSKAVRAHGWCRYHYYKLRDPRTGEPNPCAADDCDRRRWAKGYCNKHYKVHYGAFAHTCTECGKPFRGHKERVFCSRDCQYAAQTGPVHRAVKDGDPLAILVAVATCVDIDPVTGCWNWKYAKTPAGYAYIGQGGGGGLVHRHVAAAVRGTLIAALPKEETVHHKCHNRGCVNPVHLESILHRDNMGEMFERKALKAALTAQAAQLAAQAAEIAALRARLE